MRKLMLIISVLAFSSSNLFSQAGWNTVLNSYFSSDVKFLNDNLVLATGDNGIIKRSSNGGLNWAEQIIGGNGQSFSKISVIDSSVAYVAGFNNAVIKTTNSGLSWMDVAPQNFFGHYNTISFLNSSIGVIAGIRIALLTTDGGSNWTLIREATRTFYYGSFFCPAYILLGGDSTIGYPPQNFVVIEYSSDIGNTWIKTHIQSNTHGFKSLEFLNSWVGIGVSQKHLLKTTNGGLNWAVQNFQNVDLTNGTFVNENIIYVSGYNGLIMRSANGGISWTSQISGITSALRSIDFFDDNLGISSGDNYILRTTTGGLTAITQVSNEVPKEYSLYQNYPNPFNPTTVIRYSLIENRFTSLKVYNVLGNEVATLVNENQYAGSYQIEFDGSNLSSGIYFYKLTTENFSDVKKMTLLK